MGASLDEIKSLVSAAFEAGSKRLHDELTPLFGADIPATFKPIEVNNVSFDPEKRKFILNFSDASALIHINQRIGANFDPSSTNAELTFEQMYAFLKDCKKSIPEEEMRVAVSFKAGVPVEQPRPSYEQALIAAVKVGYDSDCRIKPSELVKQMGIEKGTSTEQVGEKFFTAKREEVNLKEKGFENAYDNRFHAKSVNAKGLDEKSEFISKYKSEHGAERAESLKGDFLKTKIVSYLQKKLEEVKEGCESQEDFNEKFAEIKKQPEYKILAKQQGLTSKLLNLDTSTVKALDKWASELSKDLPAKKDDNIQANIKN